MAEWSSLTVEQRHAVGSEGFDRFNRLRAPDRKVAPHPTAAQPPAPSRRLPGYSFAEIWEPQAPGRPIVRDVIDEGAISIWFGESGAMKSFAALDLVLHVASGRAWCGHETEPTGVLIVCAEGASGYRKRIRAWAIAHGMTPGDALPVWVCPEPLALVLEAATLADWLEQAEQLMGKRVGLALIDTLSTNLGTGGDDASNRDATDALNHARQAADGRAIVFVHHVGHGPKDRERGAYQIRANADVRVLVERDDTNRGRIITLRCEKSKDAEPFEPINLEWRQVDTGWLDAYGAPVTSVVLVPTDRAPEHRSVEPAGKNQKMILRVLRDSGGRIHKDQFAEACHAAGVDRKRRAEALQSLIDAGLVDRGMQFFSLVDGHA